MVNKILVWFVILQVWSYKKSPAAKLHQTTEIDSHSYVLNTTMFSFQNGEIEIVNA